MKSRSERSSLLASGIPYGQEVTSEKLRQIELAEDFLWERGFKGFRVRHHGEIARIEAAPGDMVQMIEIAGDIHTNFRKIGFKYVTLDLLGYRQGSLNEGLLQIQSPA